MDMTRRRSIQFEREATKEAARGYCDPLPIVEFSETRITRLSGEYVPDPMLVKVGRDKRRDAKEELADCRNYLVWWLEENMGDDDAPGVLLSLTHVLLAYDALCQ
jgi:hypothetical protein